MRLENMTKYDIRYLRRLFMACEKQVHFVYMGYTERSMFAHHEGRRVTVKSGKGGYVGGCAYLNSGSITMKLPPPVSTHLGHIKTENIVSARRVAQVYLHEIGHNIGLRHKQQIPSTKIKVDFWPDESLPIKPVIIKPKPNVIEIRAAKAQQKLDEWTRKSNRAKTFVKKYQRRVRYYERKMAANH